MLSHLENDCDGVDAAVFSGDMLYDPAQLELLKRYIARWERAIAHFEATTPEKEDNHAND